MNRNILVTGATSTTGRMVIEKLKKKDANFVAGVTNSTQARKMSDQGIGAIEINFADKKTLVKAMKQTTVVLLAISLIECMIDWAKNAIDAALDAGVQNLICHSLMGADIHSSYLMMKTRGMIDRFVKESGMRYTIVRPCTLMQKFATYYAGPVRDDAAFQLPQGYGRTSYVDARDVASVITGILLESDKHKYSEYDVTGDAALSNSDVAGILSAVTGARIRYVPIEDHQAMKKMRKMGMSEWLIAMTMSSHNYVKDGRAATITRTVKEITGAYPITMEQFAREHAHVWR
ncbi:hypothetical protein AMJ87_13120 [candidate division WOR_3 bacterium SM23_60]|uniref:NmrA-like domain-containing protein n=1 Tax=candidate division WOR_3 bacterium SM23_60 TaxID=1703780 RepID=A0A0S8G3P1_UNCW3|nr:MAG: hypothetical protein AMJ87_13120 [candidate division WOR_3 bacterium SM23_60]